MADVAADVVDLKGGHAPAQKVSSAALVVVVEHYVEIYLVRLVESVRLTKELASRSPRRLRPSLPR